MTLVSELEHFPIHDLNQHLNELPIRAFKRNEVVKGDQQTLCPLSYSDFDQMEDLADSVEDPIHDLSLV